MTETTPSQPTSLLDDKELSSLVYRMWVGIKTKSVKKHLGNAYLLVFEGRAAVQWLITALNMTGGIVNQQRKLGTLYGQQMLDAGYIMSVKRKPGIKEMLNLKHVDDTAFEDSKRYYQFNPVAVCKDVLSIAIFRAGGLLGKYKKGMCDPVVYVKLGGQEKHTRIIQKTQEPIWNEIFTLGIKNIEAQHLEIELYDCSSIYGLSFLGCVHIPLCNILQKNTGKISSSVSNKNNTFFSSPFSKSPSPSSSSIGASTIGTQNTTTQKINSSLTRNNNNDNNNSTLIHSTYFTKESIRRYKLQNGIKGSKVSDRVNGFIEIGVMIENKIFMSKPTNSFQLRHLKKNVACQLNVNIKRVRNAKEVGIMHLGKLIPGLKWLNRVEIRVDDKKAISEHVSKKTGPTFNEMLSLDLTSDQMKSRTLKLFVTVFQCGQLKDPGNPIGEVCLPLNEINASETTKWYPLTNKKENGEIQMSCYFQKKKVLNALGIEQLDDTVLYQNLLHKNTEVKHLKHILAQSSVNAPYAYIVRGIWHSDMFLQAFYKKRKFQLLSNLNINEWDNITKKNVAEICLEHFVGFNNNNGNEEEDNEGSRDNNNRSNDNDDIPVEGVEEIESLENVLFREIAYIVPGNALIGALRGDESQYIIVQTETLTIVRCISQTLKAPYGNRFEIWNQYTFEWIEPRVTNVTVSHKTRWVGEKPWISGNIERAVLDGTKEAAEQFVHLIETCVAGGDGSEEDAKANSTKRSWMKGMLKILFLLVSLLVVGFAIFYGEDDEQTL